jgi:predicted acyltransferase
MSQNSSSSRLVSLDALRGFDMCWILGMGGVLQGVLNRFAPGSGFTTMVSTQLDHVVWEGFRFYDLIFPLFLFIAGVSMAIALPRRLQKEGHASAVKHLLARASREGCEMDGRRSGGWGCCSALASPQQRRG